MSRQSLEQRRSETAEPSGREGLEQTTIHEILSNERRVTVLELLARERQYPVSELAEEVAAAETDQRPPPRDKRQSAYVTLDQSHLPKLDDYGVVDYDSQRKVVTRRTENFGPFRRQLADPADEPTAESPAHRAELWIDCSIAVGVAGIAATAVGRVGLSPFGTEPVQIFAEITLLALVVILVYQKGRSDTQWFGSVRDRLA